MSYRNKYADSHHDISHEPRLVRSYRSVEDRASTAVASVTLPEHGRASRQWCIMRGGDAWKQPCQHVYTPYYAWPEDSVRFCPKCSQIERFLRVSGDDTEYIDGPGPTQYSVLLILASLADACIRVEWGDSAYVTDYKGFTQRMTFGVFKSLLKRGYIEFGGYPLCYRITERGRSSFYPGIRKQRGAA